MAHSRLSLLLAPNYLELSRVQGLAGCRCDNKSLPWPNQADGGLSSAAACRRPSDAGQSSIFSFSHFRRLTYHASTSNNLYSLPKLKNSRSLLEKRHATANKYQIHYRYHTYHKYSACRLDKLSTLDIATFRCKRHCFDNDMTILTTNKYCTYI